jgi:hypothetical protein
MAQDAIINKWTDILRNTNLTLNSFEMEELCEIAITLLTEAENNKFTLLLFDARYNAIRYSLHSWYSEFYNDELLNTLRNRIRTIEMTPIQIEYYLNEMIEYSSSSNEEVEKRRIDLYSYCHVICSNDSFVRYWKANEVVFRNTVTQLIHRCFNVTNDNLYPANQLNYTIVVTCFEKIVPQLMHPILVPVFNEILNRSEKSLVNSVFKTTALSLMKQCDSIMKKEHFTCQQLLNIMNNSREFKSYCFEVLSKFPDFVQQVNNNDTAAMALFSELCNCAAPASDRSLTQIQAHLTLSSILDMIKSNQNLSINSYNIFLKIELVIIQLYASNPPIYEVEIASNFFMTLAASYVSTRYNRTNMKKDELLVLNNNIILPLVTHYRKSIQISNSNFFLKDIIRVLLYSQEEISESFVAGVQYCLDYIILCLNSSDSSASFTLQEFLSLLYYLVSMDFSREWLLVNARDKLHIICDKLIMRDTNSIANDKEVVQSGFKTLYVFVLLNHWESLFLRENETLCDFIIRFIKVQQDSLAPFISESSNEHEFYDFQVLTFILLITTRRLSQLDKQHISKSITLFNLCRLLITIGRNEGVSLQLLTLQLYQYDKSNLRETIRDSIVYLIQDVRIEMLRELSIYEMYYALFLVIDTLIDLKQSGKEVSSVISYSELEDLCYVLENTMDIQVLLSKLSRLKI